MLSLRTGMLADAKASLSGDDDVIQHRDAEKFACFCQLFGHLTVFAAGRGITTGMIVNQEDR